MEAFHCCTPAERQIKISPLLASLTTYDIYFDIADDEETKDTDETQVHNKFGGDIGIVWSVHIICTCTVLVSALTTLFHNRI